MKQAFTLIELVFVCIILSLLFSMAYVYYKPDYLRLGAEQVLNDIKYTRHLALIQNDFRVKEFNIAKREWFKAKWQLYFIRSKSATNNEQTYTIFLDKNGDGNANIGKNMINKDREIAVDLINPDILMNSGQSGVINQNDFKANLKYNIEKTYGISKVLFEGACKGSTRLIFDDYGRLYTPLKNATRTYDKLTSFNNDCIIRLSNNQNEHVCIIINPISGYAYIPKFTSHKEQNIILNNKQIFCHNL
ncbi:Tfp pilus assembly protein FimT/FimU [Campylobacter lari]|uniref:pilus assembly FimT family protein n=1 Tax=Campylobacter lari TaxID=201 RepID=UPI002152036A|nr:prepilin-type N-terminal cleavage/methylation domain-containing protein [Campylobacter lari]EGH4468030.1 prepilin-type N-terminal cleavage/methylation domain-containing protein [Campylobacter lari]MCR6547853.1 prepilin-type N-terminal cleavage/methylation domain-containing protein [Campylobacter lari]